jgi:hypothetical protein
MAKQKINDITRREFFKLGVGAVGATAVGLDWIGTAQANRPSAPDQHQILRPRHVPQEHRCARAL